MAGVSEGNTTETYVYPCDVSIHICVPPLILDVKILIIIIIHACTSVSLD